MPRHTAAPPASHGSFDSVTASPSRSSYSAQDDRALQNCATIPPAFRINIHSTGAPNDTGSRNQSRAGISSEECSLAARQSRREGSAASTCGKDVVDAPLRRRRNADALFLPSRRRDELCAALSAQTSGSNRLATDAKFTFDSDDANMPKEVQHRRLSLSSAVAIIGVPSGPMHYSRLEITFYSFRFTQQDIEAARKGDKDAVDRKAEEVARHSGTYNTRTATLQLAVDANRQVNAGNLFIPGYECTIAIEEPDLKNFLQEYHLDGKTRRLKSKGSYVCDMKSQRLGTPKFGWDIDITTPVS